MGVSRSAERADTNVCFAKHLGRGSSGTARTTKEKEREGSGPRNEGDEKGVVGERGSAGRG